MGADGSYSNPSIRALCGGEQGDHNPSDHVCASTYSTQVSVCTLCACCIVTVMMMDDVQCDREADVSEESTCSANTHSHQRQMDKGTIEFP